MSLQAKGFEFGEFFLDPKEMVLLQNGKPVSIPLKALQLLLILVENHGHLVEKDELMNAVWADSFVEEGNLAFTIRKLRAIFGDNAREPRYIENVPRRGYRFIAEVEQRASKNGLSSDAHRPTTGDASDHLTRPRSQGVGSFSVTIISAAFFVLAIVVGIWYAWKANVEAYVPILGAPFNAEMLATDGNAFHAAISPDGKNVVYVNNAGDKQSVWLRQLDSANNVEIIPPSDVFYGGLAFSPDGNFLYFTRLPKNEARQLNLYRVSIFGGVPTQIINETQGWISVSPDGERLSFVRCYYRDDDFCSLWIADAADGKNERKLTSRPRPIRIGDNKISPDGRSVAFAVGQSQNAANEFGVMAIDIETGAERQFTDQRFFNIKSLAWLPDDQGLLIAASRVPDTNFRIWRLSTSIDDVQLLTNDSETYSSLSLDKNAARLVATQTTRDFQLMRYSEGKPAERPRMLADATSVAFAPSGKIYFSSVMTGNDEIWSINADGSSQKQLTNDRASDAGPVISPNSSVVFFCSNRTGEAHVWRMNADGSSQAQLTKKEGGWPLFASPDGKWIYYHSGRERTLWRVSRDGGEEELVLNQRKSRFAFSPDGSRLAFLEKQGTEKVLNVMSVGGNKMIGTLNLPVGNTELVDVKWRPEGDQLLYILADKETGEKVLWQQSEAGGTPRILRELGNEEIHESSGFAIAPDGAAFTLVQGHWKYDAVLIRGLRTLQ
jgi:eukaryotic-like serine/threonine-protein kinase